MGDRLAYDQLSSNPDTHRQDISASSVRWPATKLGFFALLAGRGLIGGLWAYELVHHFFRRRPFNSFPLGTDGVIVGLVTLGHLNRLPCEDCDCPPGKRR